MTISHFCQVYFFKGIPGLYGYCSFEPFAISAS